jgi:uncharacterized protein DUF2877
MSEHRVMSHQTDALSMSWRVARTLRQEGWDGEVLAVHPQSCYLLGEDGAIYAVVPETFGNGPLNLVVPSSAVEPLKSSLSAGAPVTSTGDLLTIGQTLEVGLGKASLWDPKAHPALGADPQELKSGLTELYQAAVSRAPEQSLACLLPYLQEDDLPAQLEKVPHFPRSHALISGLVDSLAKRSRRSLKVVTSQLAGLGPGLTPAGDDFLAGILLALAMVQEHRADGDLADIAHLLLDTAAPRTHEISAAYLKAAYAGEASERWHALFGAVVARNTQEIGSAVQGVMSVGETSGADMLAGFLAGMDAVYKFFSPAAEGADVV